MLDKDLTAALLARTVGADVLLIATDVEAAAIGYGTDRQEWLGDGRGGPAARPARRGRVRRAAAWARRCEAALQLRRDGGRSVITSLERLREGVEGSRAGTRV